MKRAKLEQHYSPEQLAQLLSVHRKTVLRAIGRGEIACVCVFGNRLRIPQSEVEKLLAARKTPQLSAA